MLIFCEKKKNSQDEDFPRRNFELKKSLYVASKSVYYVY